MRYYGLPPSHVHGHQLGSGVYKHVSTTAYCAANLVHIKPDCRKSVLCMCSMSVRSARERLTSITDHVFDHECDIVGLTETWLTDSVNDLPLIQLLTPAGYKFLRVPRSTGGRGRGVALLYKSTMKVTVVRPPQKHRSFEALESRFSFREGRIHLVVIYRPRPSQRNRLTAGMFFDEFSDLLEIYACVLGDLILTGDFNFHFEDTDDTNTTRLRDILETFNMIQHVQDPTHERGHMLDLCISRAETCVQGASVAYLIIDHHIIQSALTVGRPDVPRENISDRKIRSIDNTAFALDLMYTELLQHTCVTLHWVVDQYNSTLSRLLDEYPSLKTKTLTIRPDAPCINYTRGKKSAASVRASFEVY